MAVWKGAWGMKYKYKFFLASMLCFSPSFGSSDTQNFYENNNVHRFAPPTPKRPKYVILQAFQIVSGPLLQTIWK